jgi:hypothetical protein
MQRIAMFFHERRQYPVGHGFFHSGSMHLRDGKPFTFIVDCGAKNVEILKKNIDEFADSHRKDEIDVLIVSHFHADHYNGLKYLLSRKSVGDVFVPFLNPIEKLLLVAQIASGGVFSTDVVEFICTPKDWFNKNRANRVITVRSGPSQNDQTNDRGEGQKSDDNWTVGIPTRTGNIGSLKSDIIGDRDPIVLGLAGKAYWEFKFYCFRETEKLSEFESCLEKYLDLNGTDIQNLADNPKQVSALVKDDTSRKKLVKCYQHATKGKLNSTCLCVLSQASQQRTPFRGYYSFAYGGEKRSTEMICPGFDSWLGLGDAELRDSSKAHALLDHFFGAGRKLIGTLALPHHGSRENHSLPLILETKPARIFVTCPYTKGGDSHHPSPDVLEQIQSRTGDRVLKVDGRIHNSLHEWLHIFSWWIPR